MPRIPKNKVSQELKITISQKLLEEIKGLNSIKDLDKFLDKILTRREKEIFLRRLAIIELVKKGKTYRKIKEILEISGATISGAKDVLSGLGYNSRNKKKRYSSGGSWVNKGNASKNPKNFVRSSKFVFKR